jgi:thioredoxin-related protein
MKRMIRFSAATALMIVAVASSSWAQADATNFTPFQQWMSAVLTSDSAALKALYSSAPPAQVRVKTVMHDASADTGFWLGLKSPSMKVEVVRVVVRPDKANIIFRADVVSGRPDGHAITVTDDQIWVKQGEQWRLIAVERTDAPQLKQPADMKKDIYPASADAHAEIKEAEEKASSAHKRLLLVFGANWCFDCHVLDLAFQRPELAPLLAANYEVVHVDLGPDEGKNPDLVQKYEIPLNKGIPALAIAESDGKLVVSQKNGEFEDARGLTPEVLLEFLGRWKPKAR